MLHDSDSDKPDNLQFHSAPYYPSKSMIIPLFSTNQLLGSTAKKRLRRRSGRSQKLTAIDSTREHFRRDLDRQSGSAGSQLGPENRTQTSPGSSSSYEWVGAPNYSNVSWFSVSITAYGKQMQAIPFGYGGGPTTVIPADQPFSGRESGGGTRSEVYGNS